MAKILGLDLETNSIGWAIRNPDLKKIEHIEKKCVIIFETGYGSEKGVEYSRTAQRTNKRTARRLYYRRRGRKAELL